MMFPVIDLRSVLWITHVHYGISTLNTRCVHTASYQATSVLEWYSLRQSSVAVAAGIVLCWWGTWGFEGHMCVLPVHTVTSIVLYSWRGGPLGENNAEVCALKTLFCWYYQHTLQREGCCKQGTILFAGCLSSSYGWAICFEVSTIAKDAVCAIAWVFISAL